MNKKIADAINKQIQTEMYASNLYLSMQCYFEDENLGGMATWMNLQSKEEWGHARKLIDFMHSRGARVVIQKIDQPTSSFKSPLAIFEAALKHEQMVTKMIHNLYELAKKEKDYAFETFIQWFITEQVEEEQSVGEIIEKMKLVGTKGAPLYMLDHELGRRAAQPAA